MQDKKALPADWRNEMCAMANCILFCLRIEKMRMRLGNLRMRLEKFRRRKKSALFFAQIEPLCKDKKWSTCESLQTCS